MEEGKVPYLCGCVLYFLLREATLPDASSRQHRAGIKDEHKNPIFMADLVYTFTGVHTEGSSGDTSRYREGKLESSVNVPFNGPSEISSYDYTVRNRYEDALNRMCEFVGWHLNTEKREWLVKACIDIIENDEGIQENDQFCLTSDGSFMSKAQIRVETYFELQPFLLGVLHYILKYRGGKNHLGVPTLEAISEKKKSKERQYAGHLGDNVSRNITVDLYEKPAVVESEPELIDQPEEIVALEPDAILEETDDEVIRGSLLRTGQVMASVLDAIPKPKIDVDGMAKALQPLVDAMDAQKHQMAEEIRKNRRQENAASEPAPAAVHEETKTTIIQQQTNVIQNGDNNVNVTNNGTINFNF